MLVSLGFHAGFLFLFMGLVKEGPKQAAQIIEGVDLLTSPSRSKPVAGVVKPVISTMDFLKMALPAPPPRVAAQAADLKIAEARKAVLIDAPKLEDKTRKSMLKLEALDLGRSRTAVADMGAELGSRRRAAQTLAGMAKLEDVGQRRVKNLPEALALEDKRREATAILGDGGVAGGGLEALRPTSRRQIMAAAAVLNETTPRAGARVGLPVLSGQIELKPRVEAAIAPKLEKIVAAAPRPVRRETAAVAEAAPKKGVEIEGPLKDRKVLSSVVPAFPEWAQKQGLMETAVAIRFTVDAGGMVLPGMSVEITSGYGRLDRLCMDSLRSWTFVPAPGSGVQWGIITFRFILE